MISFGPVLVDRELLAFPGAGGSIFFRKRPDEPDGNTTRRIFYGQRHFDADPELYIGNVRISTPLSVDRKGNLFFGFTVLGDTPIGLRSGVAKMSEDGNGVWLSAAATARGDQAVTGVAYNCAPALSADEQLMYAVVTRDAGSGFLVVVETSTLTQMNSVRLIGIGTGIDARISNDSSASPTVGPDGDVFLGVLDNPVGSNNGRGWLLHFDKWLSEAKLPGAFGWDDTASIVPATLVQNYDGPSCYLVLSKYNNYLDFGGDGNNRMALLGPQAPALDDVSGAVVMREVATIASPTPEGGKADAKGAVTEWCANSVAIDLASASAFVSNEDGNLYRWQLNENRFSEVVSLVWLSPGAREAYTPTIMGVDGAVYAISRGTLFCVGGRGRLLPPRSRM